MWEKFLWYQCLIQKLCLSYHHYIIMNFHQYQHKSVKANPTMLKKIQCSDLIKFNIVPFIGQNSQRWSGYQSRVPLTCEKSTRNHASPRHISTDSVKIIRKIINPSINLWECFNGHELKSPFEMLYNAAKPTKNNIIIKLSRG